MAAAILLSISWHCAGDSVVDVVDGALVVDVLVDVLDEGVVLDDVVVAKVVGVVQAALNWNWSAALVAGSVVWLMRARMASQRGLRAPADVSPLSPAIPAMPAQTTAQPLVKLRNRSETVSTA